MFIAAYSIQARNFKAKLGIIAQPNLLSKEYTA